MSLFVIPEVPEGVEELSMYLNCLDVSFAAVPAQYQEGQITDIMPDCNATAVYYVSLKQMQDVFNFSTTALDFQDIASNNIQFYTTWPENWQLNGCHAMVDAAMVDAGIASPDTPITMPQNIPKYDANTDGSPGAKSFSNLVIGDYMKYVSDVLFGTPYGVDLIINGNEIYTDAVTQAQGAWLDVYNRFINVSVPIGSLDISGGEVDTTSMNEMLTPDYADASGCVVTHYLVNPDSVQTAAANGDEFEDTLPLCQQLFDALWTQPERFANINIATLIDEAAALGNSADITQTPNDESLGEEIENKLRIAFPFVEGDSFAFLFTFVANVEDVNLSTGTASENRVYRIHVKINSERANTIPCAMVNSGINESELLATAAVVPVPYRVFRMIREEEALYEIEQPFDVSTELYPTYTGVHSVI
jgi:hypothetical protein